MTVYCYANLTVPPPCQMKKMGTITAINFHVSLVKQQIFTVTYFRNNIYLNYHIISAHILLLQVFVLTSLSTAFWSVGLCFQLFYIFFFLVFRSTDETTSSKLPIVILMVRDKFHEGEAKLTYRKNLKNVDTKKICWNPPKWGMAGS